MKGNHYFSLFFTDSSVAAGPPIDVYAFGMCALETAALDILTTIAPAAAAAAAPNSSAEGAAATGTSGTAHPTTSEVSDGKERPPNDGKCSTNTLGEDKASGLITEETIQKVSDECSTCIIKQFCSFTLNFF